MGSDGETILSSSGAICSTCFDDCGMANPPVGMTQVLARHVAPDGVAPADAPLEPFLLHALLFRGDEIGERVAGDVDELMCREELFDRLAWPAADKGEPVADLGVFGAPASVVECFRRGANIGLAVDYDEPLILVEMRGPSVPMSGDLLFDRVGLFPI